MQERLLSTRILDYSSLQTRWTCLERAPSADHTDWWVDGWKLLALETSKESSKLFREALELIHGNASLPCDIDLMEETIKRWKMIVEVYTQRALTSSSDCLPTISGIAERFQKILHDDYCAGLRKSDLPRGLFWRISGSYSAQKS